MSAYAEMFTPGHVFKNGCKWVIESPGMLVQAMEDLKNPSVSPCSVHITPGAAKGLQKDLFSDFLYVIVRRKCKLHVTTDHFTKPTLSTTDADEQFITRILEQCNDNVTRCTLEEFRGRLSAEDLQLLPFTLVSLGLPMATPQDVAIVETIMKDPTRMAKIQELHLSLATTLQPEDVAGLTQYCHARLCLHVSQLSDKNVEWLVDEIIALDKPFKGSHVGLDEIYLPDSDLTVKGLWELLRLLIKSHLKYPIYVDADGIHETAKKDLKEDFEKHGNQITFNTSRKPFIKWCLGFRKLMTMKHGNLTSRVTGSIYTKSVHVFDVIVGTAYSVFTSLFTRAPRPGHLALQV